MRKEKQEKKRETPAPAINKTLECAKCGKRHAGICEERRCQHCMADQERTERQRTSHFSNQFNIKFPDKAPAGWKVPTPRAEMELQGAIRETTTSQDMQARILSSIPDQVRRIKYRST